MKKSSIIIPGESGASHNAQEVNFREIRMGHIAPNTLFRSSHPIKENKQEKVISMLAAKAKIGAVLNLSDTKAEITGKSIFAPWYNRLLKNNKVIALGMDFNTTSEQFKKKLKKGLQFIISTQGPWLIHCHAGVDRTGIVVMILEAFMGATVDEITTDYLQSFNSIFDSSIYGEVNNNDSIVVMKLLSIMGNDVIINDKNLQVVAEHYLGNTIRLTAIELELLRKKLAGIQNELLTKH